MATDLVFDFDGVIADSEDIYNLAIHRGLKRAGFDYSEEEIRKKTSLQYFETIELLAKKKSKLVLKYLTDYLIERVKDRNFLFDRVKECLARLAKSYRLYIVSNSPQRLLDECVEYYQLPFSAVVGRSGSLISKKTALEYLIDKYNLDRKLTVYVGDSAEDVDLARSLGLSAFSVASGWDSEVELKRRKPDRFYINFDELTKDLTG